MGLFTRADSPFWWMNLERPGQRPYRLSTKIPVQGGSALQTRENKRLAEQVYASRMGDLARARHGLPLDKPSTTFATFRQWYAEHLSAHKRNTIREASMLRQLGRFFDRYDLHAITTSVAKEWRTWRSAQVAPATVNREIDLLRHVLAQALPTYLDTNPIAGLGDLRVPEREPRLLAPDEEARVLAVLDTVDTALILCALDTLQRLSSVAGLRREQDHGASLTFLNTKTRGGKVPVSRRLRAALDALPVDGPFFFPRYQVEHARQRQVIISRMFQDACERAHVPYGKDGGVTFHSLRHTGASRMLERGVDLDTVRRIGGWSNFDVIRRYLHPSDDASRRAVELIGSAT